MELESDNFIVYSNIQIYGRDRFMGLNPNLI